MKKIINQPELIVTPNFEKNNFKIVTKAAIYETFEMSDNDFFSHLNYKLSDWKQFLKTDQYYQIGIGLEEFIHLNDGHIYKNYIVFSFNDAVCNNHWEEITHPLALRIEEIMMDEYNFDGALIGDPFNDELINCIYFEM